ncbi:hypothetical protein [Mycobacterium intracellulare]|uniref:hypothetical protein n=1 Tax=Mycobacterium intracellulare TaxID=1767 RepID=UPI00095019D3|nr:hypothetical protein [Mycobacterium intracellulare]
MARRGVYEPVYCWLPDYATVCCRHRRWIGAGTSTLDDQRDLRCAPAVIAAAQRHARLDRCHGDAARFAVRDAARIHRCWARSTSPFTLPPARADADTHIGAYPDLIALAAILAGAHRRIWGTAPATPARARAVDAVYVNVSARFPQHRDQTRPIETVDPRSTTQRHPPRTPLRRVETTTRSIPAITVPGWASWAASGLTAACGAMAQFSPC